MADGDDRPIRYAVDDSGDRLDDSRDRQGRIVAALADAGPIPQKDPHSFRGRGCNQSPRLERRPKGGVEDNRRRTRASGHNTDYRAASQLERRGFRVKKVHDAILFQERRDAPLYALTRVLTTTQSAGAICRAFGRRSAIGIRHSVLVADPDTLSRYLRDLASEIVAMAESTNPAEDAGFGHGRRMALYEVVSLMQTQAEAFGLSLDDVGLGGIDPNRFLV
jgi:hypothetical protein